MTSMGLLGQRLSGKYPIAARTIAAAEFRLRTTKIKDSFGEEACSNHDNAWLAMTAKDHSKAKGLEGI